MLVILINSAPRLILNPVSTRYMLLLVLGPAMLRWMTTVGTSFVDWCNAFWSAEKFCSIYYFTTSPEIVLSFEGSGVSRDGLVLIGERYGNIFAKCWTDIIFSIVLMLLYVISSAWQLGWRSMHSYFADRMFVGLCVH